MQHVYNFIKLQILRPFTKVYRQIFDFFFSKVIVLWELFFGTFFTTNIKFYNWYSTHFYAKCCIYIKLKKKNIKLLSLAIFDPLTALKKTCHRKEIQKKLYYYCNENNGMGTATTILKGGLKVAVFCICLTHAKQINLVVFTFNRYGRSSGYDDEIRRQFRREVHS